MALSFTATDPGALFQARDNANAGAAKRRVLVTGAAGNIGSYFAEHSHEKYQLRLLVHHTGKETVGLEKFGEIIEANLSDLAGMKEACVGMDTVLHLAAAASPDSTWGQLLEANIIGTYNTFVAAKASGCRRVVFASSIHAVSGYAADVQVKTTDPVNPGDLYGVSKCFGEALARYMAEKEDLSVIALRIGAFQSRAAARSEDGMWMLDAFVSRRDLNQLIEKSIEVENLQFAIFNGLSNNRFKRLDISDARELLGYEPQDDMAQENPRLAALHLNEIMRSHSRADPQQKSGIREELEDSRGG